MAKLTPKQEAFAKAIAYDGMNQSDAYRSVYNTKNMSEGCLWTEASQLAANPKVAQRIKELAKELDSPKIMNATKRREKLTVLADSEDPNVVMKAIDLLNKMDGEYVQKVEAEVTNAISINIELSDD